MRGTRERPAPVDGELMTIEELMGVEAELTVELRVVRLEMGGSTGGLEKDEAEEWE